MPTKNARITALEREVESLKEQLKFCKMVAEKPKQEPVYGPRPETIKEMQKTATETVSPTPQPAASSSVSSETKQS